MKTNMIIVSDCKESIIRDELWKSTDDYSLFHITPTRTISHKGIFDDCSFIDLYIDHKTDWGAPIPSTFQNFFKDILELIIPRGYMLVLNIVDLYEGYFDQDQFKETFIEPNGYAWFQVDKEIGDNMFSTMFFECPIERVCILQDVAFPGTVIDVEGFVLNGSKLDLFPLWQKMGNTDTMFRDLLRNQYLAFRLWRDHNGMFIATDKFDIPTFQKTLFDSPIEQQIRHYVSSLS